MQRHKKIIRPPPAPVSTGAKEDHSGPLDGVYTPMPEDWVPPPPAPAMFTDVVGRVYAWQPAPPQPSDYDKLRDAFTNRDLWDTLTPDLVDMMLNPPATYDPVYQRKVNVAVLTCIKTLANVQRAESDWAFEQSALLEKRVGALERGPKRW